MPKVDHKLTLVVPFTAGGDTLEIPKIAPLSEEH
jgi:hypothetical protein